MITVPPAAEKALKILEAGGFDAYIVGGYVRDLLLGFESADIDITTGATPDEVKELFSSCRIVETGIRHGTVTVILDGTSFEITTFRGDGSYADNRHPDSITFKSSLDEDLSRRDFTVNAICLDVKGKVIDKFGGEEDLEKKLIRAIGDPEQRFREDSLRILRAIRFASVYGFSIESGTDRAIHKLAVLIHNLSKERVFSELTRILAGENIEDILLEYYDVFNIFLPEIDGMYGFNQRNFHHKYDLWTHTSHVVSSVKPETALRMAALFHDCAKVDTFSIDEQGVGHFYSHAPFGAKKAREALSRLRAPSAVIEKVSFLVKVHDSPIEEKKAIVKKKLNKYGEENLRALIELQRADTLSLADEYRARLSHFDVLERIINEIISENECFSLKELAVNGDDIIALGFSGPDVGKRLAFLLNAVIDGKEKNDRESLLGYLDFYEEN